MKGCFSRIKIQRFLVGKSAEKKSEDIKEKKIKTVIENTKHGCIVKHKQSIVGGEEIKIKIIETNNKKLKGLTSLPSKIEKRDVGIVKVEEELIFVKIGEGLSKNVIKKINQWVIESIGEVVASIYTIKNKVYFLIKPYSQNTARALLTSGSQDWEKTISKIKTKNKRVLIEEMIEKVLSCYESANTGFTLEKILLTDHCVVPVLREREGDKEQIIDLIKKIASHMKDEKESETFEEYLTVMLSAALNMSWNEAKRKTKEIISSKPS